MMNAGLLDGKARCTRDGFDCYSLAEGGTKELAYTKAAVNIQ